MSEQNRSIEPKYISSPMPDDFEGTQKEWDMLVARREDIRINSLNEQREKSAAEKAARAANSVVDSSRVGPEKRTDYPKTATEGITDVSVDEDVMAAIRAIKT